MYFPSQEKAEEKYGAVTFKVFFDFNNQKLQVEGRFICTTPDIKHFFLQAIRGGKPFLHSLAECVWCINYISYC